MEGEEIFLTSDFNYRKLETKFESYKCDLIATKARMYNTLEDHRNDLDKKLNIIIEEIQDEIKTTSVECNKVSTEIRGMLLDYINCEIEDVKASQKKLRKEMFISYICAFLFFSLLIFFCK